MSLSLHMSLSIKSNLARGQTVKLTFLSKMCTSTRYFLFFLIRFKTEQNSCYIVRFYFEKPTRCLPSIIRSELSLFSCNETFKEINNCCQKGYEISRFYQYYSISRSKMHFIIFVDAHPIF